MSDPSNPSGKISDPFQPADIAFGLSIAAVIMVVFGFFWLGWGFSNSPLFTNFSSGRLRPAIFWIAFYGASLVFLRIAIRALRRAHCLMKVSSPGSQRWRSRLGKQFRLISILEGIGCGIALFLSSHFHRMDLLAAGIGIVVGLHFLPMARLFRFPAYYITGIAIVLCGGLSMLLLQGNPATLCAGVGAGTALWITAVYALARSMRLLNQVRAQ